MRVAVAGATGNIGALTVAALEHGGHYVVRIQRVRDGRLRTNIGGIETLDDAVIALNPTERRTGKTIIRIRP